jgi:hypothetical protein
MSTRPPAQTARNYCDPKGDSTRYPRWVACGSKSSCCRLLSTPKHLAAHEGADGDQDSGCHDRGDPTRRWTAPLVGHRDEAHKPCRSQQSQREPPPPLSSGRPDLDHGHRAIRRDVGSSGRAFDHACQSLPRDRDYVPGDGPTYREPSQTSFVRDATTWRPRDDNAQQRRFLHGLVSHQRRSAQRSTLARLHRRGFTVAGVGNVGSSAAT